MGILSRCPHFQYLLYMVIEFYIFLQFFKILLWGEWFGEGRNFCGIFCWVNMWDEKKGSRSCYLKLPDVVHSNWRYQCDGDQQVDGVLLPEQPCCIWSRGKKTKIEFRSCRHSNWIYVNQSFHFAERRWGIKDCICRAVFLAMYGVSNYPGLCSLSRTLVNSK